MLTGLGASFSHNQNGMTLRDMEATKRVADRLDEVIIFRSTGPWSMRWLEKKYPSKNFHVKGKSSDWGPHAGLVPYNGIYSKVGYDPVKAAKGTKANDDGLKSGFAGKQALVLTKDQIDEQLNRPEGSPARTAIQSTFPIKGGDDLLLICKRSGDGKRIVFRACSLRGNEFEIRVYAAEGLGALNPFVIADRDPKGEKAQVLEVMTSNEIGAGRPMTGDYDLFSICPSWAQYGSLSSRDISKDAIKLANGAIHPGQHFSLGQGMDNVLDPSLHTMSQRGDFAKRQAALKERMTKGGGLPGGLTPQLSKVYFGASGAAEHGDMGNLTPRILRCINELNGEMGAVGETAALRRVHHNAESHRNRAFGALTENDMLTPKEGDQYADGFPLTVFQPSPLYSGRALGPRLRAVARYGDVCTLESLLEFKTYAQALKESDYFVPKNWIWGT
jgi:hypothetical protein